MRTLNFTLLTVLSYLAVIVGAAPLGNRVPAEAIDRRREYVRLTTARRGSDPIENISPAYALPILLGSAKVSALSDLISARGSAMTLTTLSALRKSFPPAL